MDAALQARASEPFCIVGAGFSGLAVAGAFERHGIDYEILEATDAIGGNWSHGVYETAHIISSRKTTQYSDWPMPRDWPDFPSAEQMRGYLRGYAEHTGAAERVRFSTRALRATPASGDLWEVELETPEGTQTRRYAGLVVCNGHHWDMRWPEYPGELSAERIHSKQYKGPECLRGKRVLVIGGGNSGCDIAVEAARFAAESHISLRRGYWFFPKTVAGRPLVEWMSPWVPAALEEQVLRRVLRMVVGPYARYGLQEPEHGIFDRHPTINSQLLYFLKHGTISPHPDVARFEGQRVHFVDGTHIDVDLVVCATGFHVSIPFLGDDVVRWSGGYPDLVYGIFPPRHKNLYVMGIGQPRYGAGPLLSVGTEVLARCVKTQPKLRHPIGAIFQALGQGPLESYLMDPHVAIRRARFSGWLVPKLPWLERFLMPTAKPPRRFSPGLSNSDA